MNSNECIGIDINEEGIKKCHDVGYTNTLVYDVLDSRLPLPLPPSHKVYDYAILGEILEHVSDPCSFLRALNKQLANK